MRFYNMVVSQEDRELFKEIMVKMLLEGAYVSEIAAKLGVSETFAHLLKDELVVVDRKIKRSEIEAALLKRKNEENEARKSEYMPKILEGLKAGKSQSKIGEEVGFSSSRIGQLAQELIDSKLITRDQITQAKKNRRAEEKAEKQKEEEKIKAENSDNNIDKDNATAILNAPNREEAIIEGIKRGMSYLKIGNVIGISPTRVGQLVEKILDEEKVTREQIKAWKVLGRERADRKKLDEYGREKTDKMEYEIYRLMCLGIPKRHVCNILKVEPELFDEIRKKLIKDGRMSTELIRQYIEARENRNREKVLELLKQGYNCAEMADKIEYADKQYTKRIMLALIDDELISPEEIQSAREARLENYKSFILEKSIEGYTAEEIAEMDEGKKLGIEANSVAYYRQALVREGKLDRKEMQKARYVRENEKRAEKEDVQPDDERIMNLTRLGFTIEQIQKAIGRGSRYLVKRKKVLKGQGILPKSEYMKAMNKREENAEKRRSALEGIVSYSRNMDVGVVKDHIEYTRAKFDIGELAMKDINLVQRVIPMEHELMSLKNINFVISCLSQNDKLKQAVDFLNRCLESAREEQEEKIQKILELKELLERELKRRKEKQVSKRDKWLNNGIKVKVGQVTYSQEQTDKDSMRKPSKDNIR